MKTCSICKEDKSLEEFHKDSSREDGRYPYCKPCRRDFTRKSYYDNPIRQRHRALKNNYGITFEELTDMAESQEYNCAICKRNFKEDFLNYRHRHIHVDHCHATGQVREILCQSCNHMIGKANDNINILKAAIEYLARHRGG